MERTPLRTTIIFVMPHRSEQLNPPQRQSIAMPWSFDHASKLSFDLRQPVVHFHTDDLRALIETVLDEAHPYDERGYCSSKTVTATACCVARRAWP